MIAAIIFFIFKYLVQRNYQEIFLCSHHFFCLEDGTKFSINYKRNELRKLRKIDWGFRVNTSLVLSIKYYLKGNDVNRISNLHSCVLLNSFLTHTIVFPVTFSMYMCNTDYNLRLIYLNNL